MSCQFFDAKILPFSAPSIIGSKMAETRIYTGNVAGIGPITMTVDDRLLRTVTFAPPARNLKRLPFDAAIQKWINNYLKGNTSKFPYSLDLRGTPFQRDVWMTLLTIPHGQTRTYGWVAHAIGRPKASRAVGQACGANPIPLIIPCHRVTAQSNLGGFSSGLAIKKSLLRIENSHNIK